MAFRPLTQKEDRIVLLERLEELDDKIKAWSVETKNHLKFKLASLNLKDRVRLSNEVSLRQSVGYGIAKNSGDINAIYFRFLRHGIFIEHGVGRGRPKGSAAANRNKQPWLSEVLPDQIEVLAELFANEYADIAAEQLRFLIPGIIDTKINI